ncbi:M56 family metallopeptidase [Flavobacterium rhizosphaerae]|uniref:M56 family metallopeptidase n=1 Tax=Flavobacterium rhizosphaerae TaxID=3163298 RepID=A0ABW8YZ18_9FLAO
MIPFLLKSTAALAIFIGIYYLMLEREKMHRFNRFYLLGTLVFSFILPFISIPIYTEAIIQPAEMFIQQEITIQPQPAPQAETNYVAYFLWGLYGVVTFLLAVRFVFNIVQFSKIKKQNPTTKHKGATLVLMDKPVMPYTFLGCIYINKQEYESRLIEPELFTHEMVHVKQLHTLDILFIETLKTIFWFNPLLYIYKKAVRLNHEFLADENTINQFQNILTYQKLLLDKALPTNQYALASSINFSLTKKRFIMMNKTTSRTKAIALKTMLVPVFAVLTGLLCTEEVAAQQPDINAIPADKVIAIATEPATQAQIDSLRRAYPGKYTEPVSHYSHTKVKYENDNGKEVTAYYFIDNGAKEQAEFSPGFANALQNIPPESIESITVDPATAREMDSLKANHKTLAGFDANGSYAKMTVTYTDKDGTVHIAKDFVKRTAKVAPKPASFTAKDLSVQETNTYSPAGMDKQPEFPGGMAEFYKYVNKNFNIPQIEQDLKARIFISFIIEKDGSMSDIRAVKDPGYGLGDEAVRVLKSLDVKWIPGEIKGEKVRADYKLPIVINITGTAEKEPAEKENKQ